VTVTANITSTGNNGAGVVQGFEAFAVSGATTIAANDAQSVMVGVTGSSTQHADTVQNQVSATYVVTGLTNGNNTFTLNYRSSGGDTITYSNRSIIVIPLP
jgi:acetolactate synthase regulatory subunit